MHGTDPLHTDISFGPLSHSLTNQHVVEGLFRAVQMCVWLLVCSGRISQSGLYTEISFSWARSDASLLSELHHLDVFPVEPINLF